MTQEHMNPAGVDIAALLHQKTPVFPPEALHAFVEGYFDRKDVYLRLGVEHGGPLYVFEPRVLLERARIFRDTFLAHIPESQCFYAIKSNNYPGVASTLLQSEYGLDVSSGLELDLALKLGAPAIVFSGPGKTPAELQLAVEHPDIVIVHLDSFGELQRLEAQAAARNVVIRAGVRLSPSGNAEWQKFGIPQSKLAEFVVAAQRCPHVNLCGLQFHCSWNMEPSRQIAEIRTIGAQMRTLSTAFLRDMDFLDIGGGYWPPQGEWLLEAGTSAGALRQQLGIASQNGHAAYRAPAAPIETFARDIGDAIRTHIHPHAHCRILLEPGRWVCNDCMQLLIRVVDRKSDDLVITDAGMNAIGWERFETEYYPVLNLSRPSMAERKCRIMGSLCTPHDVWGYAYWGEDIQPGDILLIPTQGAYTYSLRQNFIKPLPDVVTVEG